jgi:hypothetical protein
MDMNEYTLGEGKLIYIPKWADDPDMLYREAKKLSFTPETVTMYGKTNTIERQTVDYGLPYSYNKTAKPSIEWEGVAIEVRKRLELAYSPTSGSGSRRGGRTKNLAVFL